MGKKVTGQLTQDHNTVGPHTKKLDEITHEDPLPMRELLSTEKTRRKVKRKAVKKSRKKNRRK